MCLIIKRPSFLVLAYVYADFGNKAQLIFSLPLLYFYLSLKIKSGFLATKLNFSPQLLSRGYTLGHLYGLTKYHKIIADFILNMYLCTSYL